ncbi:hypothetical protein DOY81_006926 [Sarcophaga bullata]|nr:hypothetical protein DOY81_006926 [Sarcophaga bullata]
MATPSKSRLPTAASVSRTEEAASSSPDTVANLLDGVRDRIVLVEFFAKWCGPCQNLATKLEDLASSYNGKVLIVKVDVDEFEEIALEYDVSAMPTFAVIKNRKKVHQFSSSNIENLEGILQKYAGKAEDSGEKHKREETVKKTKKLAAKPGVKN